MKDVNIQQLHECQSVGYRIGDKLYYGLTLSEDDPYYTSDKYVYASSYDRRERKFINVSEIDEIFLRDANDFPLREGDYVYKKISKLNGAYMVPAKIVDIRFTKMGKVTLQYYPTDSNVMIYNSLPKTNEPQTLVSCNWYKNLNLK